MLRKSLGNFLGGENGAPTASQQNTRNTSSRNSSRVGSAQSRRTSTRLGARSSDEMSGRLATPVVPVIRNSVILQQAKIKNYSDFILYFLNEQKKPKDQEVHQESHVHDEPISIKKVEEIIVDSSALYERTFNDETAVQVMDEYVSMLKAIRMSYSEWFDFVGIRCKRRDAMTKDEFQREIIRLCQDLRRSPMEEPNILILFQYIYGNYHPHHHLQHLPIDPNTFPNTLPNTLPNTNATANDSANESANTNNAAVQGKEELLEKEHLDVAFEKFQLSQSLTRKLTVAASQMRSLGSYMKQNEIKLLDIARTIDDLPILDNECIATSLLDTLLTSLVANYDAYVYEHGTPVDLIESIAANFGHLGAGGGGSGGAGMGGGNMNGGGGRRRHSRQGSNGENSLGLPAGMMMMPEDSHSPDTGLSSARGMSSTIHGQPPLHRLLSEDMDESPAELRLLMKHKSQQFHQNSFKVGSVEVSVPSTVSNVMNTLGTMANSLSKQFTFQNNTSIVPMNGHEDQHLQHQQPHLQQHLQQQQTQQQTQQPVSKKKQHKDDLIDLQANNEYIKHLNIEEQMQFMRLVDPHHPHHNYDEVESHFQTNIIATRRRTSYGEDEEHLAQPPMHDPQSVQSIAARYSVASHAHPSATTNGHGHGHTDHQSSSSAHPTGLQRGNTEQQELQFYQNYYNAEANNDAVIGSQDGSYRHYMRQQGDDGIGNSHGDGNGNGEVVEGGVGGVGGEAQGLVQPSTRRRQSVGSIPSNLPAAGSVPVGGVTAAGTAGGVERPMSSTGTGGRRGSVLGGNAAVENNSQFRGLLDSFNSRLGSAKSAMVKNR